jgi:hypothetical protein
MTAAATNNVGCLPIQVRSRFRDRGEQKASAVKPSSEMLMRRQTSRLGIDGPLQQAIGAADVNTRLHWRRPAASHRTTWRTVR